MILKFRRTYYRILTRPNAQDPGKIVFCPEYRHWWCPFWLSTYSLPYGQFNEKACGSREQALRQLWLAEDMFRTKSAARRQIEPIEFDHQYPMFP